MRILWRRLAGLVVIGGVIFGSDFSTALAEKTRNDVHDGDRRFKQTFFVRGFVLPASAVQLVESDDLATLSCQDLWAARNEIYYRNGYCFRDARGARYFGRKGCHRRRRPPLSRVEAENVRRIRAAERASRC